MSEAASEATAQEPNEANETGAEQSSDETDWKAEARKWEQRAKTNAEAASRVKEFEKQRKAAMTEAERAVSEAEERGRTAASQEFGKRLVKAEFDAAAGRRNPDFDTNSALEYVDLAKFIGEDGEPNTKAIKAAVERLVPAASGAPSFDGGSRTKAATGGDMNTIIRKAAGRA